MSEFYVGQKVVCIRSGFDREFRIYPPPGGVPKVGTVYTISNIYTPDNFELMLELVEKPAPENDHWYAGFCAKHFRPLDERKTDISAFTRLLQPEKVKS